MSHTLIGCVGGFLGAGKTTALLTLAQRLAARGVRVGVVTNDQGRELVDTAAFRAIGVPTEEVPGGCICCRFDDLVAGVDRLRELAGAEVVLVEAVGSCTDLASTVYRPLRRLFADRLVLAPLTVFVEPPRLRDLVEGPSPFPREVDYILERQMAEADLLVLSKADTLDATAREETLWMLRQLAPRTPSIQVSGMTGDGVDTWLSRLAADEVAGERLMAVDYERYARGEAALAWLNATFEVRAREPVSPADVGEALVAGVAGRVDTGGHAVAHVKALIATGNGSVRVAHTGNGRVQVVQGAPLAPATVMTAMLNARVVALVPDLEAIAREVVADVMAHLNMEAEVRAFECFSPPAPRPTHGRTV